MSAPKTTPKNSPMFYYHIAEAAYQKHPEHYLEKALGGRRVQKLAGDGDFGFLKQWKVRFFRDSASGELIVGFRGSDNFLNFLSDVSHGIADADHLFRTMNKQIAVWKKFAESQGYGSHISAFVGHSAGGYFASHVRKKWDVWRITFNGHKCERAQAGGGRLTINLRIGGDIVSNAVCGSVKDRYIKVRLPEEPKLKKKILLNVHKLRCFAMAFAQNGGGLSHEWFKHPHPVAERSWHEVCSDYFAAPHPVPRSVRPQERPSVAQAPEQGASSADVTTPNITALPDEPESDPVLPEYSEQPLESPPESETVTPAGGYGHELRDLQERCQERLTQTAKVTVIVALKTIFRNAREKAVLEDLKNGQFGTAVSKLGIEQAAKDARKTFCEIYLSIMSNTIKQGVCIMLSAGYVNPLITRSGLEFATSFMNSDAQNRREQLSDAVSGATLNMVTPVLDGYLGSLESETYIRGFTELVFDNTPEALVGRLVEEPIKQTVDNVINSASEDLTTQKPNIKWGKWRGEPFSYQPGILTQDCENESLPTALFRSVTEGCVIAFAAMGNIALAGVAAPVYLAGEEKLARDFLEEYVSCVNQRILGTFMPHPMRLKNVYATSHTSSVDEPQSST